MVVGALGMLYKGLEIKGRIKNIQITALLRLNRILRRVLEPWFWYWLLWFYGISTTVGYLMPNPVFTYMICKHIFLIHIIK